MSINKILTNDLPDVSINKIQILTCISYHGKFQKRKDNIVTEKFSNDLVFFHAK